ncbi:hypothetical protein O0L34_g10544 [Tuta absoluta]|nr:hypothetical protein O0L34_g10544 [Tuta absoluta]
MASVAVAEEKGGDEAEQKLLERNDVVLQARQEDLLTGKSSKKVKLPEDEVSKGRGDPNFTIGPAPERDWEMVPPDGKWGWFVLVGATLVNILIPGTIKSFGVLLVEFNDVFNPSAAASSGIVALCYFLYSSLGPLSSILSVKWSYRTVTLVGGSFAAFGMIASSMAYSITYLYFSFGAMVGTGAGLAFPPTVYIVTSYFVRLRGLANGICMSGSAFGSIILPPVLRYLLEEYGYKGAVLILGGIMLNVWAAALLFQPVEEHMVKRYKDEEEDPEDVEQNQDDILFEEDEPIESYDMHAIPSPEKAGKIENGHLEPKLPQNLSHSHLEPKLPQNLSHTCMPSLEPFAEEEDDFDSSQPKLMISPEETTPGDKPNGSPPVMATEGSANNVSAPPFSRSNTHNILRSDSERVRKISTPASSKHGLQHIPSKISNHLPSNASFLESVPEGKTSRVASTEAFRRLAVPKTPKRSPSTSSFQYMSTPFHGSTLSAFEKPSEFASQFSLKSVTESLAPISYCCGCKKKSSAEDAKKEPSKYFDLQLLKDPIYLVILFSNCTSAISYTNFIILVPSYAVECGFDKSGGAYLLSIISALDLVGRIGGSALSDIVTFPKRYFFITGLLISGIGLSLVPLVTSYLAVSVWCSMFGIASGINTGVTALVMTEMLGHERLMSSYGISLFCNGILQLIGPPICGLWFERTKSYKSLFVTLGFVLMFGASLWLFVPIINSRRRRAQRRKEVAENKS